MKVVYTDEALADLDEILGYISSHYPAACTPFEQRLRIIEARVSAWPESALEVAERPGVRVVPFIRYHTRYSIESRTKQWRSSTFTTLRVAPHGKGSNDKD